MMSRPAVAVALLVVAMWTTGCTDRSTPSDTSDSGPVAGTTATPTPGQASTPSYPPHQPATVPPFDPEHVRTFPMDAAIGTPYPVDITAHCPIDVIEFGGATWRAEERVDLGGFVGVVAGTLELLDQDTARLVIDLRYFPSPTEVVVYHKTTDQAPACL
jgi:hypothetical protein